MAQHRTRKEKEKAQQIRLEQLSSADPVISKTSLYSYSGEASKSNSAPSSTSLLKVDQRYILKDLVKTVSISSILLLIVIGIYFYLRYN